MTIFDFVKENQKTLTISFDQNKKRYNIICPIENDNYGFCIEDDDSKDEKLDEALQVGLPVIKQI